MRKLAVTKAAAVVLMLAGAVGARGQDADKPRTTEVPTAIVSVEIRSFPKPLQLGAARPLKEALLVAVAVPAEEYDALPPDIEPFLYVGALELRTFQVYRGEDPKTLLVTFFSRQTDAKLDDGAPLVLTIDHGAPIREPERFTSRADLPRFRKEWLKDRS